MKVFFSASGFDEWESLLQDAVPFADFVTEARPADVDAILYKPSSGLSDFSPYVNCGLVQNLWAGVERLVDNPTLTQPLARMVDPGLIAGMIEYCVGWTLHAHLGISDLPQDGQWRPELLAPLASSRNVVILGTGELGSAVGRALADLGFRVTGWSRSGRPVDGINVCSGAVEDALTGADIVIGLLPQTDATTDLLDAKRLKLIAKGGWVINAGRGSLIVERDLIDSIDHGPVSGAVLDVFRQEPLPAEHPFWAHPRITVTPHIAAATRPITAVTVVAENLRRLRDGQPRLHLVDRERGY